MSEKSNVLFVTRLGGIMAAVGSAVGLGNIWRFPYEVGQNGGAAFILLYLGCVLFLGTPLMLAELTLGRMTHRSPVGAFRQLARGHWWLLGYVGALTMLFIVGFYSVVAGWTLSYTAGALVNSLPDFGAYSQSALMPLFWSSLFILLNALILSRGVQKGIERASNLLMPCLFVLLLVLCVRSLFLPGAVDGLKFLFHPDFSKIDSGVVVSAMGQSFFSISVGIGCLLTYGSYLHDGTKMGKTALSITLLDTLVAILAGIVIFPACFSFGVEPGAGPGLAFITLPNVFAQMHGGYLWSLIFFVLLAVAALTSTLSMFESPIAILCDEFHVSRRRAVVIVSLIGWVLSVGCTLSFVPECREALTFWGYTLFDVFDRLTANILMPVCGLLIALCTGWVVDQRLVRKAFSNNGADTAWFYWPFRLLVGVFAPICILLIFLSLWNIG